LPDRNLAPQIAAEGFKERVEAFAKQHDLDINPKNLFKVEWMQTHGGLCFCDPFSDRRCPCSSVFDDIGKFNGYCLCSVFYTHDKFKELQNRKPAKKLSPEEKRARKKRSVEKAKESKKLFDRLTKKRKRGI